jgi:hypothetical protein
VRRKNDAPFLAVWDAWKDMPNLNAVTPGSGRRSVKIETQADSYYVVFGGGAAFPDGVSLSTDSVFAIYRASGGLMFAGGTRATVTTSEATLRVAADDVASVSAEFADGKVAYDVSGDIQYDTWGGVDHYRKPPEVAVVIEGTLWKVKHTLSRAETIAVSSH